MNRPVHPLDPQSIYRPVGDLAVEKTDTELLVLMLQNGSYFGLGKVGSFIWEHLDGEQSLHELSLEVSGTFAVERPQALEDLLEFTGELLEAGLIEKVL